MNRVFLRAVAVAVSTVALDQAIKAEAGPVVRNTGIAGGGEPFSGPLTIVLASACFVAVAGWLGRCAGRREFAAVPVGFLLGGGASNLADRLVSGSVRDVVPIGQLVANPADLAIAVGLVWLTAVLRRRREVTS